MNRKYKRTAYIWSINLL